jgi:mRNA interferase RelE/StbE
VRYRIEITKTAKRELRALPANVAKRVDVRVASLAEDPRPVGVRKIVGAEDLYRVRVGDYRIVYEIQDATVLITIIRVRHRGDVYR